MHFITIFSPSVLENYKVGTAAYHIICKKLQQVPVQLCISNTGHVVAFESVQCNTAEDWASAELHDMQQQDVSF